VSVSLSVSSVLCLSHSYTLCSLHTCPVSLMSDTHFCLDFFASICCYMYPPTYLSHSYTQCLLYVSISLSLSHLPLILRHYVGIACVQLCSSVVSYTCFHINSSYQLTELCRHACQSDCSSTWLSIRFLCIVAHLSALLSSFTFSTYYHHFLS